jgi:S-DNA-T family DNA segregation ATPase FtsK/SpoIIIE
MLPRPTIFNRAPRLQFPDISSLEIDLPRAPEASQPAEFNWLVTLTPLLGFGAMAVFYLARGGVNSPISILPLLLLASVSIVSTVLLQRWRTNSTQTAQKRQLLEYQQTLDNKRVRLQATRDALWAVMTRNFPSPHELLNLALEANPRLWERRPHDPDFTQYRVGTGRITMPINIRTPDLDWELDRHQAVRALLEQYSTLEHAPVTLSLQHDRSTAIIGRRVSLLGHIRALVCQLALTHAPQDLYIYVIASQSALNDWSWVTWLPHVTQNDPYGVAFTPETTRNLLGYLSQLLDSRHHTRAITPHILLIVDDPQALEAEPVFSLLLRQGEQYGATTICLVNRFEQTPGDCQTIIQLDAKDRFKIQRVGTNGVEQQGDSADILSLNDATHIARVLAPISMQEGGALGRIPPRVELLGLYGVQTLEELRAQLPQRWQRPSDGMLPRPVPIGLESQTTETFLWLHEEHHGPHGVLAGTTGSGKSELLQSLVCALAIEHDPRFLNVLLIDFKGGSTFGTFADLPHTAGMVTNLDAVQVQRMLEALKSEIEWRQQFLKDISVRDITQYHRFYTTEERFNRADYQALPHLVIIVDEFAQLAREMPDFMSELVRIAQVGRSLGLHLILGTQSPMDVITDEMNANLQFRICLRVQNVEASRAVLHRPDAAYLPAGRAGRGYLQVGERGLFKQFQSAYSGADYHDHVLVDETPILEWVSPIGETHNLWHDTDAPNPHAEPHTVANAICEIISTFAKQIRIPPTKPLLLPSLAQRQALTSIHQRLRGGCDGYRWTTAYDSDNTPIALGSAPIGWIDDVTNRAQYPLWVHFNNDRRQYDGHLLIVGMPSSGKTTLLKSLALSLAVLHSPDALHLYFISFTGNGLNTLAQLPHAERVVQGIERERVRRLFGRLMKRLEQHTLASDETSPTMILFIDQYEQFRDMYRDTHLADLERLINEGRSARIFVVLTASHINAIPDRFRAVISQRIAFQQATLADYVLAVGRVVLPDAPLPQGRCFVHASPPLLAHISLPSLNPLVSMHQNAIQHALEQSVQALQEAYQLMTLGQKDLQLRVQSPAPLRELPQRLLSGKLSSLEGKPAHVITPLGWRDDDSLSEFHLDWWQDGTHFVVVGPPTSGKTNLLQLAVLTSAKQYPPSQLRFLLVDFNQRSLRPLDALKHVIYRATDGLELKHHLQHLQSELTALQQQGGILPITVLVIDDYDLFADTLANDYDVLHQLRHLARFYNDVPFHIWVAGYLERANDPFIKQLLLRRSGFGLMMRESLQRLNMRASHVSNEVLAVGRAYVANINAVDVVQTALIDNLGRDIDQINDDLWADYPSANWFYPTNQIAPYAPIAYSSSVNDDGDIDTTGLLDDLLNE